MDTVYNCDIYTVSTFLDLIKWLKLQWLRQLNTLQLVKMETDDEQMKMCQS